MHEDRGHRPQVECRMPSDGTRTERSEGMVPEEGIEPTRALSPPDFESGASASFTTPASSGHRHYINNARVVRSTLPFDPEHERRNSRVSDPTAVYTPRFVRLNLTFDF